MKVGDHSRIADVRQVLVELAEIAHASSGSDLFACCERLEGGTARLFQLPRCEVRIGQDHSGEEVDAHEHVAANAPDAATRVLGGIRGAAEITHAMAELGGKLGFIEILNPRRIGLRVTPLEFPHFFGESMVT